MRKVKKKIWKKCCPTAEIADLTISIRVEED
jgi:hypothetical protein